MGFLVGLISRWAHCRPVEAGGGSRHELTCATEAVKQMVDKGESVVVREGRVIEASKLRESGGVRGGVCTITT